VVNFPDYDEAELVEIFEAMAESAGFTLQEGVQAEVRRALRATKRDESFGNGRVIRNLLDRAIALQGERITASTNPPTEEEVRLLTAPDLAESGVPKLANPEATFGQYL
jgi:hypothetical protein